MPGRAGPGIRRGSLGRILRYPQRAILDAGMTLAAAALEWRIRKALRRSGEADQEPQVGRPG